LGQAIPNIDNYILYIVLGITVVSVVPAYLEYRKHHKKSAE
jgi:hypothetical protein